MTETRTSWVLRPVQAAALSLSLIGGAVAQVPPGGASAGPVQVGVVTLHPAAVPVTAELPGRVSASQTADVRPQVGGIVESIDFRPGQQVAAGDVLYHIDSASYDAQVEVQQAALQKAQAAETSAQATVDRSQQLATTNNLSQSDLQTAQLALAQAKADVASANASLRSAQINADLTKVTSPITGLIGESAVTQGALVTAAQATALATVRQLDPSYVDLIETSTNLLKLRSQLDAGTLKGNGPGPNTTPVHLELEDGTAYTEPGTLTITDVVISESTGTFSIRATFPNPRRLLLPGMFVRATVDLGSQPDAYRVPQLAVTFDATGQPTALFAENGKAVSHVLVTNGTIDNDWVVSSGVTDGAQLIVDGFQKISAGAAVTTVPVTLSAEGVATDSGSAPASASASEAPAASSTAASSASSAE